MRAACLLLASMWLYPTAAIAQAPEPGISAETTQAAEPSPDTAPPDARMDAPTAETPPGMLVEPTAAPEAVTLAPDDAGQVIGALPPEAEPLSQTELDGLGFSAGEGGEVSTLDTDLHVSGFVDFNVTRLTVEKGHVSRGYTPPHTNFYVGNFNLYLSKNLTETFRTMGEIRFTYLPNGQVPGTEGSFGTPTTSAKDYADFERPLKWGGIEIERVYLEWSPFRYLSIRAGQFLTPYGIWNVDHGSPTFIPVQRPYVIGGSLFPERQTGFELFGRWYATDKGILGYHLTLSNGTGPVSEYRDLDENKAIGGRLFWQQLGLGNFRVGISAYYGRDSDATPGVVPDAEGNLVPDETLHRQFDVLSLAADLKWQWKGLLLQAEYVSQQLRYTKDGRQAAISPFTRQLVFPIDTFNWGYYALAGYRLPWFGIMPYSVFSEADMTNNGLLVRLVGISGGLNIRAYDAIVLKLEYLHILLKEELAGGRDPFRILQAQIAWAF